MTDISVHIFVHNKYPNLSKIYFHEYIIGKNKNYYEKLKIFTHRIILPQINL